MPNVQLRHIRLENNDNKPVTNSRDTQEVPHAKGLQVLRVLHSYRHSTSIFDDFVHYEKRQEEEDSRKQPTTVKDNSGSGSGGGGGHHHQHHHHENSNNRSGGGGGGGGGQNEHRERPDHRPNRNHDHRDNDRDNHRSGHRNNDHHSGHHKVIFQELWIILFLLIVDFLFQDRGESNRGRGGRGGRN